MPTTITPGLLEALRAVSKLTDDELVLLVASGQARIREAVEAGADVDAQCAGFYLHLALYELEQRVVAA